jgi:hypothetical protein
MLFRAFLRLEVIQRRIAEDRCLSTYSRSMTSGGPRWANSQLMAPSVLLKMPRPVDA